MAAKTVRVNRRGNGLGIRLPKEFVVGANITESSQVEVSVTEKGLFITRVKEHIPLAERLKGWNGQPYELTGEDRAWLVS
jgi:antitoxin component of MazEF toxin-antitoxin module